MSEALAQYPGMLARHLFTLIEVALTDTDKTHRGALIQLQHAARARVSQTRIGAYMKILKSKGRVPLVDTITDETDQKANKVILTKQGDAFLRVLIAKMKEACE